MSKLDFVYIYIGGTRHQYEMPKWESDQPNWEGGHEIVIKVSAEELGKWALPWGRTNSVIAATRYQVHVKLDRSPAT